MKQLPLFSAEQEAERTLQEAYDLLVHDYRYMEASLEARLEKAKVEYRKLREERDRLATLAHMVQVREQDLSMQLFTVRQERDTAWQRLQHLEIWAKTLEAMLARHQHTPAPAPTLEPTLKKLLFVAHPDRWSQGQDASQLAHELSVVINQLRAEGS